MTKRGDELGPQAKDPIATRTAERLPPVARLWRSHLAPVTLVIFLAVLGLGQIVVHPEGLLNRHSDLVAYHLSAQTVAHESWQRDHRLPVWRFDVLSGAPARSNPQALYTHPFHILFWFFPPPRVVGLVMWLHMLTAALGAYGQLHFQTKHDRRTAAWRISSKSGKSSSLRRRSSVRQPWVLTKFVISSRPPTAIRATLATASRVSLKNMKEPRFKASSPFQGARSPDLNGGIQQCPLATTMKQGYDD
jgi:hypothetical protein